MDNLKTRNFRFLLYPDNLDHMKTLKIIKRSPDFRKCYCGIWHQIPDSKKHCHVLITFQNPRSWYQLIKDTSCSQRFCRPIGYEPDKRDPEHWKRCPKKDNWEKACAYLPHYTDLDKEQYLLSDIFGYPDIVQNARKNAIAWQSRNLSTADCLLAVRSWICSHYGEYIRSMQYVSWITGTSYMKVLNSPIVAKMIADHNATVAYQEQRQFDYDLDAARAAAAAQLEKEKEMERALLAAGFVSVDLEEPLF